MNLDDPYANDKEKEEPEKETPKQKQKKKDSTNLYSELSDEDEVEEEESEEDLDGEEDEYEEEETPWFKNIKVLVVIVLGTVIAGALLYFFVLKEEPPPPPPVTEETEPVNEVDVIKDELYQLGIGKEAVNDVNIYDQGPIESADFRKDFVNTDSAENYKQPVTIVAVNDSVSYTKHRTMTDDGMDMYWVDAMYKSKKTRFTMPYYIWQTLAPQGVMDVIVEVVTDADGKRFVASITPVPPSKGE